MTENFANAGVYLVQTLFGLYILVILLRFLIQAVRADFYNPVSQGIVKITDPPLKPLRRLVPRLRNIDLAALLVALILQVVQIILIYLILAEPLPNPLIMILWALVGLASLLLKIFYFALIIMVIASWIAPQGNHPVLGLVYQLVDPICAPARKILPPMGGLDFSIILVFVAITLIDSFLVIRPLQILLNIPPGLLFGL